MSAKSKTVGIVTPVAFQDEVESIKIQLDDLVSVISLIDYPLNLLPQTGGRAKHRFENFGQKKPIIYQDILRILEEYPEFHEKGYFYILDERVVKRHGLQDIQNKILDKKKIEDILDNSKDAFSIFKLATENQQKTIVGMLTRRVFDSPDSVDMNLIEQVSRHSKVNILKNVEEMHINLEKEEVETSK